MQEKQHLFYVFYNMFFISLSLKLLISFNTSKIRIIYITAKKYSIYFIFISYVIKHSLLAMNANTYLICYHVNNTPPHAVHLLIT